MTITMEPEKMRVNFENLFNNKELSDNMNAVLNENNDVLFKGLQGPMQNILGDAMLKIYEPVALKIAYADFFVNDD
ncbi:hypothetical protein HA402_014618 [Bradysia odoriphaga]|nr:hypothetical protein HA402_014618 [Bradysia odoriphaga]